MRTGLDSFRGGIIGVAVLTHDVAVLWRWLTRVSHKGHKGWVQRAPCRARKPGNGRRQ